MRHLILSSLFFALAHAEPVDSLGTIQGIVVCGDESPGSFANVIIVGTRLGTQADVEGRFRIDRVPPGRQVVRTLLLGHDSRSDTVEVHAFSKVELRVTLNGAPLPRPVRVGARAAVREQDLVTTIEPAGPFRVGDRPRFRVRIRNGGSDSTVLIRAVEGSQRGMSPAAWIAIVGPTDGLPTWGTLIGGNSRFVRESDFVEVAPDSRSIHSGR